MVSLRKVLLLTEESSSTPTEAAQTKDKKSRIRQRALSDDHADECEKQKVPDSKAKSPENASFGEDASEAESAEQAGEQIGQIESRLYLPVRQRKLPHGKHRQAENKDTDQKRNKKRANHWNEF